MFKNLIKALALLLISTSAYAQTVTDFQRNSNGATILQNTNLGRMPAAANEYGRIFNDAAKVVSGTLDMTSTSSAVSLVNDGYSTVTIYFVRTAETGSLIPQYSYDGTNWFNAFYYSTTSGSTANTPATSNVNITFAGQEILKVEAGGYPFVRIKVSGAGAGSLPVYLIGKNSVVYTAINNILPGTAATNLGKAEDSSHVTGDVGVFGLGVANTNAATLAAEGDYVGGAHGTNGSYLVDIKRALQVSDAGSLLKAEDATHATGDAGVLSLGVSNTDLGGALCNSSGDYCPIATAVNGALYAIPAVSNSAVSTARVEDSASASGDAIMVVGGIREDTLTSSTTTTGDYINFKADALGRQPVALQQNRTGVKMATVVTVTNTTETTLVAAGGAGVFNDLTLVACINTSATPVRVDIRDATAGTVRFPLYVPAGDMRGYMNPILIPQTTAANNWTFQASASVTDLRCWAGYITNQ